MIKKLIILIILIGGIFLSCSDNSQHSHKKETLAFDLDSIRVRGTLAAVTDFNPAIHSKYYVNIGPNEIVKSEHYAQGTSKVSPWDDIIKQYSVSIKWDWRLLASLICQESRFLPDVVSKAGAYGLMQIMPETGRHFGIDITSSPKDNLKAGAQYINWLHTIFDPRIPDINERTKFILASYNAGPGHVLDAMKLAEKHGKDPQKWEDNVAVWLLKKSDPQYYTDAVVKYGYFRGKESIAFVNQVLNRYEHYKNIVPAEKVN